MFEGDLDFRFFKIIIKSLVYEPNPSKIVVFEPKPSKIAKFAPC